MRVLLSILFALLVGGSADAATVVARATGNFTTAATWGTTYGAQEATSAQTNCTTAYVYSPIFTITNGEILEGVVMTLRSSVSPSGTVTVALSDDNGVTATREVTINVSDLSLSSTYVPRIALKFGATLTADGGTDYRVGFKCSTTGMVAAYRDATAANWQRNVWTQTTAAPVATDAFRILSHWTAAATKTDFTVTMNETATTAYGSGEVTYGSTLQYANAAATNYVLRMAGELNIVSGSTFTIGTVGSPIPRSSTAVLEFVCASAGQWGLNIRNANVVMQGESPMAGVTAVWGLLNTDEAIGQTVLGVDRQLSAMTGDRIAIASTSRSAGDAEVRTLASNASASDVTVTAGLTLAHLGTSPYQAEVISITRNVKVRSTAPAQATYVNMTDVSNGDFDWVEFQYIGTGTQNKHGMSLEHTTGSTVTVEWCAFVETLQFPFVIGPVAGTGGANTVVSNNVFWSNQNAASGILYLRSSVRDITVDNNVIIADSTGSNGLQLEGGAGLLTWLSINGNRITSANRGINVIAVATNIFNGQTITNTVVHSMQNQGFYADKQFSSLNIDGFTVWRTISCAIYVISHYHTVRVKNFTFTGNACNIAQGPGVLTHDAVYENGFISGDTTFASSSGIFIDHGGYLANWRVRNVVFGSATPPYALITPNDISLASGNPTYWDMLFSDVALNGATDVAIANAGWPGGNFRFQAEGGPTVHRVVTMYGRAERSTTGCDAGPCVVITPSNVAGKILSSGHAYLPGWRIPIVSGQAATFSIKGKKSAAYNGNPARLMIKSNAAIGLDDDVVCDTHSAAADTFETLTCTTAAVTADGFVEFYIEVDGTAGTYTVDTLTVTAPFAFADTLGTWADGLPILNLAGGGGREVSLPYLH